MFSIHWEFLFLIHYFFIFTNSVVSFPSSLHFLPQGGIIQSHWRQHGQLQFQTLKIQVDIVNQPQKTKSDYPLDGNFQQILLYSKQFRNLRFDFDDDELRKLAYSVRDLYKQTKIAMFFIPAYFIRGCQILEQSKVPPVEISKIIKKKVKVLMNMTSIATYRREKYGYVSDQESDPTAWKEILDEIESMTPREYSLAQSRDKDSQVEDIVQQIIDQAAQRFPLFDQMASTACREGGGSSYHINFKITDKSQRKQMKRVKEKLLREYLSIYGNKCSNTFLNIQQKRVNEEIRFESLLSKIYKKLTKVKFIVKDILRAKCMFNSVTQVRSAALALLKSVKQLKQQEKKIKIIEFENRLNKITSDIMLIIQIDDILTQIQFSLAYDESLFDISHKMYEIRRSKVFSPIVMLFNEFEKSGADFLYTLGAFLENRGMAENVNKEVQDKKSLAKEYALLNQFFHLTEKHNFRGEGQQKLQKQISTQILKINGNIIQPFQNMTGQVIQEM